MEVFDKYADYYDIFYSNKNYKMEAVYVDELIQECKPGAGSMLDLGCGTGNHDLEFVKMGYDVTGFDNSTKMISLATSKLALNGIGHDRLRFGHGDMRILRTGHKYDVVLSLFHVICYQTTTGDVECALATARTHLPAGGLFIFDIWYGPAVLHLKPEKRINHYTRDDLQITRISEPETRPDQQLVDVNYRLEIRDVNNKLREEIFEVHTMRYFFMDEIKAMLSKHGFKVHGVYQWMTRSEPDDNSWSAGVIAGAI